MSLVTDPVCGVRFDVSRAVATSTVNGRTWYFCSDDCCVVFEERSRDFRDRLGGPKDIPSTAR